MSFREMKDYELAGLGDEDLIAYVARARRAGATDAIHLGLGVFAHRRYDDLVRRALVKMPSHADAEDVAMQTIRDVFRSAFDGSSVGEARSLISTVLARRIADWHESRKRTEQLPEESDENDYKGRDVAVVEGEAAAIEFQDVVDRVYAALESDHHRMVVDDYVTNQYGARETAERVNEAFPDLDTPKSETNVHQVASRFRKDLREALEEE